ncbi:hypothetical protein O181_063324 [Austropuccinia psidii MF-1]|uniref:Reverse transcriptase Ty1/copia-type domain-containing protein n=1 Tax=Austropuccinia psidii MF-1 TaxID=1389203 RepID=A0A9Q3EM84_9BASI|nr:hypothetical protein [Austropuccinia psidii MF-1]
MNLLGVWDVVKLDPSFKLVGTTWVLKIKKHHLGHITEYKARLSFSAAKGLEFHQIDIKRAFLNAPLSETVYLGIPQGLNIDKCTMCLRLQKAIYVLKQAPLAWYERLKNWPTTVGFVASILDPCVFLQRGEHLVWLYIHVDDIAIFGRWVEDFKMEVLKEFEIKDVGPAELMLGIKVTHFSDYVSLDQQHFTKSLLELYGMCNCNSVLTPLIPNEHLSPASPNEILEFGKLKVNF